MYPTREHYRKNLKTFGRMAVHGEMVKFKTVDVSAGGAKVHLELLPDVGQPMPVELFLDDLQAKGQATIIWSKSDDEGGCYVGLKFNQLQGNAAGLKFS